MGASDKSDRAGRPADQAPAGLGDPATIPCAWRPIETAPRDGSQFLTFSPDSSWPVDVAQYDPDDGEWCKVMCGFAYATHWMPLPPAPEPNKAAQILSIETPDYIITWGETLIVPRPAPEPNSEGAT